MLGEAALHMSRNKKKIGILINGNLNLEDHINDKVHKLQSRIANMKRVFMYVDVDPNTHSRIRCNSIESTANEGCK